MCRPKGKSFCPGGILRISRDWDDRMALTIKTRKKSLGLLTKPTQNSLTKIKLTPKKSHAEFLSLKNLRGGRRNKMAAHNNGLVEQ